MSHLLSRLIQFILYTAKLFIRIPLPHVIEGINLQNDLVSILKKHAHTRVLWVTDKTLVDLGLDRSYRNALRDAHIDLIEWSHVHPNPHVEDIENAAHHYRRHQATAIVGIGGGSVMDCAKGVGAIIATKRPLSQLRGLLRVRRKPPLMIMIPTTCGTGSEATVAVVVSNPKTKEKYAISDPVLVPKYAILDVGFLQSIPPTILAMTAMDALTHAIEASLNLFHTPFSTKQATQAMHAIMEALMPAYHHPDHLEAKKKLLKASYDAGTAFTRDYVGYVHGIAHTLGAFYDVPHGLANAVILPYVLEAYGSRIHAQLARWFDARQPNTSLTRAEKAKAFLDWLRACNATFGFPSNFSHVIEVNDIPAMVTHMKREMIPFYPVPKYLSSRVIHHLYDQLRTPTR